MRFGCGSPRDPKPQPTYGEPVLGPMSQNAGYVPVAGFPDGPSGLPDALHCLLDGTVSLLP